jgi:histidyl-tRNA synthetase
VGDASDIVQKEMYTFEDKGGRSVSLRPECTAGTLRSVIENMPNAVLPLKLMYFGPCFRYEKPQSGRYREFFQFGVEIFGGDSFSADAEVIFTADHIFKNLRIKNINLEINAIGCKECGKIYKDIIVKFFNQKIDDLCSDCLKRLQKNPLRIFDCKTEKCKKICTEAPHTIDCLCENCRNEFERIKLCLQSAGIKYNINTRMVRGLDYYTKFVFEFIMETENGSLTVCGGGRYDGLSEKMGGPNLSAVGFGIGIERIISVMKNQDIGFPILEPRKIYVAVLDNESRIYAAKIISDLRSSGIKADVDLTGRSIKSQIRFADKMKYEYFMCLGGDEIKSGLCEIKRMSDGKIYKVNLDDNFAKNLIFKTRG